MKFSDRSLQRFCIAAALLLIAGQTYRGLVVGANHWIELVAPLALVVYLLGAAYRLSPGARRRPGLDTLITRTPEQLLIYSLPGGGAVAGDAIALPIDRISRLTVGKGYLSVILDDNGNGYDFSLGEPKEHILDRLKQLLPKERLDGIAIELV